MNLKTTIFGSLLILQSCLFAETGIREFPPMAVVPSEKQINYQRMEIIGFIHFGVNTFTDREWGTGSEDPAVFNPVALDADQWAGTAKGAGMGMLILTAKHHDGFCLWPSSFTEHSVKSSAWKGGNGDVVGELSDACGKQGIKFGIYLSPWDMHEPAYGTNTYNQYYLNQLEELLTGYGKISEVWMDGAKGKNAKNMEYDFDAYRSLVYKLQPDALIFSDVGPDVRWIGNEHGIAGETNWSTITTEGLEIGRADTDYLNTGDPAGSKWLVGECDVSIRPGWFYHASQDSLVKSPEYLVDLYYKSVGRNGTLLLNLPPDRRGLIHEDDIKSLKEFRAILDETFRRDIFREGKAAATSQWSSDQEYNPGNLLDGDAETYWAADEKEEAPAITIELNEPVTFDRLMLQEPVRKGQRVSEFEVEAYVDGAWKTISNGTTIGYKRLLRFDPVTTDRVRVRLTGFLSTPALSTVAGFSAGPKERIFYQ